MARALDVAGGAAPSASASASSAPREASRPAEPSTPATASPASSATPRADATRVTRLLEVTGASAVGSQVFESIAGGLNPLGQMPQGLLDAARARLQSREWVERIVMPLIARHWSAAEVEELIRFHESPLGQRSAAAQKAIAGELQPTLFRLALAVAQDKPALRPRRVEAEAPKERAARFFIEKTGVVRALDAALEKAHPSGARKPPNSQAVLDALVPSYVRHYEQADLEALAAWYDTPIGQRALTDLPRTVAELVEATRAWADSVLRETTGASLGSRPARAPRESASPREKTSPSGTAR